VNNGRAVATPGLLKGLELAHLEHGRLPWADLFAPAIQLAEQGFPVSPRLHILLSTTPALKQQTAAAHYFYDKNGHAWPIGHILRNPAFAQVLRKVANQGVNAFYQGQIAQDIVAAVQAHPTPGDLSLLDMANYQAIVRQPVCGNYRQYRLCGPPPPNSGTLAVLQILGQLERFRIPQPNSPAFVHLFTESGRLAFADRNFYVADPAYVSVPTQAMISPQYLRQRSALIQPDRNIGTAQPGDPAGMLSRRAKDNALEVPSTTHLVAVDREGNIVSMTSTIESAFGSKIFVHGFLLNNEMTDFSFSYQDAQGRPIANRIEPGKRPRTSMAPLIVFEGNKPYLALGSPGGSAIINYVAKTLIGVIDWKLDVQAAINLPNMGGRDQAVELEKGTELEHLAPDLQAMGHEISLVDFPSGVQAIMLRPGELLGGADPRREGLAIGK
jgi:gamma-glutamyltranspeptidase/glutathione hydrolase